MSMNVGALMLPAPAVASGTSRTGDTPEKVRDAAGQFESMLIGQLLRSARESCSDSAEEQGGSNSTYMELAEQQFAQALAARGGMGVAKMVVAQLGRS